MPQYGKTSRSKAKEAVLVEMETVVAHVEEEDGEIIMRVEGQATDFTSEAEGESDSGSESDPDEGGRPTNNNATRAHHHDDSQTSMESMDEGGQSQSTVDSGHREVNLDDAMMEKMAKFMQKRGLFFSPAEGASSNADAVQKGMET